MELRRGQSTKEAESRNLPMDEGGVYGTRVELMGE